MSSKVLYFQLFKNMFEIFNKEKVSSLSMITNEHFLVSLLKQIEPKIEKFGKTFDLGKDQDFGIRYSNFLNIISVLDAYKSNSPSKDSFKETTNFSETLKINDLIKKDETQLILLAEIIIFISAISSKKDSYVDIVTELDEKFCSLYYQTVEKFIVMAPGDETINLSRLERSFMKINDVNKIKENYEKQIANYIVIITDNNSKINELKKKIEDLENKISELEIRGKDKDKEIELLKEDRKQNLILQEKFYTETLSKGELAGQLNLKESEIKDLRTQIKNNQKRYMDEVNSYKDKITILEDKLKETSFKLEKMNKYKNDLSRMDNKADSFKKAGNDKYRELYLKDKQNLQNQIDKLLQEVQNEKQRYFKCEEEKNKLERSLREAKEEFESYKLIKSNTMGTDKSDLMKMIDDKTEELEQITKEKEDLQSENETNKMEIERLNKKLREYTETEKRNSRDKNYFDYEKKAKESENKLKEIISQNKKENEKLKNELTATKNIAQKALNDKEKFMNNYKALSKEFEKYKAENKPSKSQKKTGNIKDNSTLLSSVQNESELLKNEIKNLKEQLNEKDETIEQLQNALMEKENNEENEFFKRSFEEQKLRVNEEHKLICDSLFKLAVHFTSLKDDLQKKFSVNNK
ncbi:MAG: hypothetical protein MJ252_14645 [archaeon]|nr:hypothetical protein [archaeon]